MAGGGCRSGSPARALAVVQEVTTERAERGGVVNGEGFCFPHVSDLLEMISDPFIPT